MPKQKTSLGKVIGFGLALWAIAALSTKKKPQAQENQENPNTEPNPQTNTNVDPNVKLKAANLDTVKAAQTLINTLFNTIRTQGSNVYMWWSVQPDIPNNLVVDGIPGNLTKNAIKYVYAWSYNTSNPDATKKKATDITWDVLDITLSQLQASATNILYPQ